MNQLILIDGYLIDLSHIVSINKYSHSGYNVTSFSITFIGGSTIGIPRHESSTWVEYEEIERVYNLLINEWMLYKGSNEQKYKSIDIKRNEYER